MRIPMLGGKYRKIYYFFSANQKGNDKKKDKDGSDNITDISYKI